MAESMGNSFDEPAINQMEHETGPEIPEIPDQEAPPPPTADVPD